jgi:hypothetical protein
MHKLSITLLLSLTCYASICTAKNVLPFKTDVVVDGVNNEWKTPLPKYDKTTCINYEVANDQKNLYFILRITDEATKKQIIQNGLEIWINKDGKKDTLTGVTYPVIARKKAQTTGMPFQQEQNAAPTGSASTEKTTTNKAQDTAKVVFTPTKDLKLTRFLVNNGIQPIKGCPVQILAAEDNSGSLIYELAIPFNTFYKESLDESDAKVKFAFGFIVKGSATENDIMGAMMGSMMGGMGGPGGGGPSRSDMQAMRSVMGLNTSATTTFDKKLWFKTYLAVQKTTK